MALWHISDNGDRMGRYLVSFKVNWDSFPADPSEKANLIELIHTKTKEAMGKGVLTYWGISLDLTHGYAIWDVEAGEMAKIAVLRMPYLEPVEIRELLTLDQFAEIATEVTKAKE
jgi:hypothetical protein